MASSLNIPKKDLPILKKLLDLSDRQFASLLSAIRKAKPTVSTRKFVHNIAHKVNNIQKPEIAELLRVSFLLYIMKDKAGTSAQELAQSVAESYSKSSARDTQLASKHVRRLANRIAALLSFDKSMAVTAKAFDILTEHDHTFCRSRILSDIRPIFTDSAESASAAVIIHTLQIGFHDGGSGPHKEFYVALDTHDIQILKEIITRAEKKTVALEAILRTSKVPYLEV